MRHSREFRPAEACRLGAHFAEPARLGRPIGNARVERPLGELAGEDRRIVEVAVAERDVARTGLSRRFLCRSEEHTSELQSLLRISSAVFCLKTKNTAHKKL